MTLTKQEIFTTVKTHLLKQMKKSQNPEMTKCLYRGPDGTKCAVGCLITDEEYKPEMEALSVKGILGLTRNGIPLWITSNVKPEQVQFLQELQFIHDEFLVEEWQGELAIFAQKHSLSFD